MQQRRWSRLRWLTLYAVAMGVLEAVVVVYLRELYYPEGFRFPIVVITGRVALAELVRELTTLLMMLAVAGLAGRSRTDAFFVFAYLFGVWDLVYYAGLWAFLGWPTSLFTWDVLFLIPLPWLGPVLYPVIVALLLITGFLVHDTLQKRGRALSLTVAEWITASLGGLLVVVAFCWNWRAVSAGTVPTSFPFWPFFVGLLAGVTPFVRAGFRSRIGQA